MLAVGVAVNVMGAGARHQITGHVVERDDVLVVIGVLVALVRDVDLTGGDDVEAELFGLRAFLGLLVRFKVHGRCR
ncbi:hypothetical protein DMJ13_18395 [halophilic archaeon]|nr:hypothetical protein DMJ13_18395 [halophilic archaeon]